MNVKWLDILKSRAKTTCPNYLLYPSDLLSVCSCIVCCFNSSLELNTV